MGLEKGLISKELLDEFLAAPTMEAKLLVIEKTKAWRIKQGERVWGHAPAASATGRSRLRRAHPPSRAPNACPPKPHPAPA